MARATVRLALRPGLPDAPDAPDPPDGGGEREWSLIWVPLPGAGEPSALLVVEDATEVLRSQRLLAWAEMARMIAHEIKNPLTPIRLSTEHMVEVYRHDPDGFDRVFERCTNNILTQVEELRSIASEFSAYSSIPRIDPKPGDLVASLADLVEGYRAAPPAGGRRIELDVRAAGDRRPLRRQAAAPRRAQPDRERPARHRRQRRPRRRRQRRSTAGGGSPASPSSTPAPASPRTSCRASSTPTSRPTTPAPGSACRSPAGSPRSTAAGSPPATGRRGGSRSW